MKACVEVLVGASGRKSHTTTVQFSGLAVSDAQQCSKTSSEDYLNDTDSLSFLKKFMFRRPPLA